MNGVSNVSRCSSVSTIDSALAAELVKQCETSRPSSNLATDGPNSKPHSNMKFEKSEGIHVGDIINYYYQSPSIGDTVTSKHSNINNPPHPFDSSTEIISTTSSTNAKKCSLLICFRRKYILVIILISSIVTVAAITSALFMTSNKPDIEQTTITTTTAAATTTAHPPLSSSTSSGAVTTTEPVSVTTTPTTTTTTPPPFTLPPKITLESYRDRAAWNAEPARAEIELKLPVYRIIIAHTGGEGCSSESECKRVVRELQEASNHLDDIPYNFLIGDDTCIYEGRGFERQGQHSSNRDASEYDSIGICIGFIGDYETRGPSESQVRVFNEFIEYFVEKEVIVENFTIFSHDQLVNNEKPADKLNEVIRDWRGFRNLQKIYHRDEWGAEPAKSFHKFNHAINWTLITGNYTPKCANFSHCAADVRQIQQDAFDNGLSDVPYAFMIGGDGLIFEGLGWDIMGEHTEGYDNRTVAIHIIDDNIVVPPNEFVINATYNLMQDGAALGKLTRDFVVNGRQELSIKFNGPGFGFIKVIKTWRQWQWLPKEISACDTSNPQCSDFQFFIGLLGVLRKAHNDFDRIVSDLELEEYARDAASLVDVAKKAQQIDDLKPLAEKIHVEDPIAKQFIQPRIKAFLADASFRIEGSAVEISKKIMSSRDFEDFFKTYAEVRVICDTLHIDRDLPEAARGKNLAIFANFIYVHGNVTWDLSGKYRAAPPAAGRNANDEGLDGIDGEPGESGGNCKIKSKISCENIEMLKIVTSGANGTSGQDGGDGRDGRDGDDAKMSDFHDDGTDFRMLPYNEGDRHRWADASWANYERFLTLNRTEKQKFIFVSRMTMDAYGLMLIAGSDGEEGTAGGYGGMSGAGGYAGAVSIECPDGRHATVKAALGQLGSKGTDGIDGFNGRDGRDAYKFDGMWWNQPEFVGFEEPARYTIECSSTAPSKSIKIYDRDRSYVYASFSHLISLVKDRAAKKDKSNEDIVRMEAHRKPQIDMNELTSRYESFLLND